MPALHEAARRARGVGKSRAREGAGGTGRSGERLSWSDRDTLEALKELSAGDKLVVITDYLPARQTIPRLVEQRGCSWQMTEDDGETFRLEIVKGE